MKSPATGKILWLIKSKDAKRDVLGFLRDAQGGFFVIGGETGSHYSGHGEKWQTKWNYYISNGYIDSEMAIKLELVPPEWKPPTVKKSDRDIIKKILSGVL